MAAARHVDLVLMAGADAQGFGGPHKGCTSTFLGGKLSAHGVVQTGGDRLRTIFFDTKD